MDDLTYTLRELCRRNRDGSRATQADRQRTLTLASRHLREAGFWQMRATLLKGRHVDVLIARWKGENLSAGTLKNRIAHLRWWAEKVVALHVNLDKTVEVTKETSTAQAASLNRCWFVILRCARAAAIRRARSSRTSSGFPRCHVAGVM